MVVVPPQGIHPGGPGNQLGVLPSVAFTIYCHTHIASGKRYVGQTQFTLRYRWGQHVRGAYKSAPQCRVFARAIRAHGPEEFTHEELECVETQEEANVAEGKWIAHFDCIAPHGYNLQAVGTSHPMHDETKHRLSASQRARHASRTPGQREETSRKIKAALLSVPPEERRARAVRRQAALSPQKKGEASRKAWFSQDPEVRRATLAKATAASAARSSEQRKEAARRVQAGFSPEYHREWSQKARAAITPEQRREGVRRSALTRRRLRDEAALLGRKPTKAVRAVVDKVRELGPATSPQVAVQLGLTVNAALLRLSRAVREGLLYRAAYGVYTVDSPAPHGVP